jgi:hypothetical protein
MFDDARQIAAVLFSCINLVAAGPRQVEEILRVFAAAAT